MPLRREHKPVLEFLGLCATDVRKSYAFPSELQPPAAMPSLVEQESGGIAASGLGWLSEKHSFSAHRAAQPQEGRRMTNGNSYVLDFSQVGNKDVALVGGKCASLGELFRELTTQGVRAVDGFSTTSFAYELLLETNGLRKKLQKLLKGLDVNDLDELARVGGEARALMLETPFPPEVEAAIHDGYKRLGERIGKKNFEVAVRSSATAEDLPDASFAGQQDTILNVRGEQRLIEACHECFASLWTDRAISYRTAKGFDHFDVALSIGIQPMVRSDAACSGVMFTLDTESGFREAVVINGAWGLGEAVVQGMATPDEWIVFKPTLKLGFRPIVTRKLGVKEVKMVFADDGTGTQVRDVVESQRKRFCLAGFEVLQLAKWACAIEDHYSNLAGQHQPMDIEWAKDGITGELFILQARPETVHTQNGYKFHRNLSPYGRSRSAAGDGRRRRRKDRKRCCPRHA